MGQQEVYDFLMKHPDQWYTSKQISEQLIVSIGSVTMSLKKLRKTNIIKFRNTGKRNTFQYMVQSEPAKLLERKNPMLEHTQSQETRVKVKIKPKIVHQHTYLGGQTFYGVIKPKEEPRAEPLHSEPTIAAAKVVKVVRRKTTKAKRAGRKTKAKPKKVMRTRKTRAKRSRR